MTTIEEVAKVLCVDADELSEHFAYVVREERIKGVKVWTVSTKDNRAHLSLTFSNGDLVSALFYAREDLRWGLWRTKHLCSWAIGDGPLSEFVGCLLGALKSN